MPTLTSILGVYLTIINYQGAIKTANIINEKRNDEEKVYNYKYDHYEMFFYFEESVEQIRSDDELQNILKNKGS